MNPRLRTLFPRGSKSFFKANETDPIPGIPDTNPKPNEAAALDAAIPRKEKGLGRVEVRYRLCRVRPLDPDNAAGSTKDLTDGLCRCGLIPGDDPTQITLIVEQEKVKSYYFEHTQIEITYPNEKNLRIPQTIT